MKQNENLVLNKSFDFAVQIVKFTEQLEDLRKFHLANQLFRSGTSIGANVREAQHAESRNDFVHKMKIAVKEAEESAYWLELCNSCENYPNANDLLPESKSLIRILSKIIASSKAEVAEH